MSAYWIVVANASRARIFEADAKDTAMREIASMVHPASRLHEGDLISDNRGQVLSAANGGHSQSKEARAKQHEAEVFARQICERLEQARLDGEFRRLYLLASPRFLGLMRKHMAKPLSDKVYEAASKDLTLAEPVSINALAI